MVISLLVGCCYWPPSSIVLYVDNICDMLQIIVGEDKETYFMVNRNIVATVRKTKVPKDGPQILSQIPKYKYFNGEAFVKDIQELSWDRICLTGNWCCP